MAGETSASGLVVLPVSTAFVQNSELPAKRRTSLFLRPIFRAQMAKRLAFDDEARNWIL